MNFKPTIRRMKMSNYLEVQSRGGGGLSSGDQFFIIHAVTLLLIASLLSQAIMVPDLAPREELLDSQYEKLESTTGNRSSISSRILNSGMERRKISKSIPCVKSFLRQHLDDLGGSSLLIPDSEWDASGLIGLFMRELHADGVMYVLDGHAEQPIRYNRSSSALILTDGTSSFMNMSSHLFFLCGRDCKYVIILTSVFEDSESFLEESDNLLKEMWKQWVAKAVVLGTVGSTVLVAGTNSFKSGELCAPSDPELQGSCENDSWKNLTHLRSLLMNKCLVSVAFYENFPYAGTFNDSDSIYGFEGQLVKSIVRSIGADLMGEPISSDNATDVYEDLLEKLHSNASYDYIFGGIPWAPNKELDFTYSYDMVHIAWMIPVVANVSLKGLIAPFTLSTWLAVLGALLLGSLVKIFLIRDISFLDLFAVFFQVSVSRLPSKDSSRLKIISWVLFSFFLAQYYLASLAGQLMNASQAQIETMKELVNSGYVWGGTQRHKEIFSEIDETDDDVEDDEIIREIYNKFLVFDQIEYMNKLADIMSGRNTTLALVVMLNVTTDRMPFEDEVHIMSEIMGCFPLAIATWVGNPFLAETNLQIQYIVQGGFIKLWAKGIMLNGTYFKDMNDDPIEAGNLGLEQLIPGFLLLVFGYGLGFIMFIVEIAVYPSKYLY